MLQNKINTICGLNSHHHNIEFTLEQNPKKLLETNNNKMKTQVFIKKSLDLVHWS